MGTTSRFRPAPKPTGLRLKPYFHSPVPTATVSLRNRATPASPKPIRRHHWEPQPMPKKRLSRVHPLVRPPPSDGRPKNRLLAALPADDFYRLRPFLKTVPIRVKQVLQKNGAPLPTVYFSHGGVGAITT